MLNFRRALARWEYLFFSCCVISAKVLLGSVDGLKMGSNPKPWVPRFLRVIFPSTLPLKHFNELDLPESQKTTEE